MSFGSKPIAVEDSRAALNVQNPRNRKSAAKNEIGELAHDNPAETLQWRAV